jgi:hypothetical protein
VGAERIVSYVMSSLGTDVYRFVPNDKKLVTNFLLSEPVARQASEKGRRISVKGWRCLIWPNLGLDQGGEPEKVAGY